MTPVRQLATMLSLLALAVPCLPGCGNTAAPEQNRANVQNANPPSAISTIPNRTSSGITVRNDVIRQMNKLSGVQNAVVLLHGGNAYVGFADIGPEHTPDAAMRSGDNWNGGLPYGTQSHPKSAKGMTVHELLREGIPNASSHDGPHSTLTGNLSPDKLRLVTAMVQHMVPGVGNVYVTTVHTRVQKMQGYRHFISRGGNMSTHMTDFHQFLTQAFPGQTPGSQR